MELDNVIVTPHIGGSTRDVVTRQSALATEELVRFAKGERLVNLANPEVYGGG